MADADPDRAFARTALRLGDAPALLISVGAHERAAERGTVLFHHGFTSAKEGNWNEYRPLARAGFLVVALDNVAHGERRPADFDERARTGSWDDFCALVLATARETPEVVDALVARGLARPGGVGMAGWSMGGYVAFRSLLEEPRLGAVVTVVASPSWGDGHPQSPHRHPERVGAPLLSLVAAEDEVVPPDQARAFHRALDALPGAPTHEFLAYPGVGHGVSAAVARDVQGRMVAWFERFLPSA